MFKKTYKLLKEFYDRAESVSHIDHVEERVYSDGANNVTDTVQTLQEALNFISSASTHKVSLKYDGSPAIVAGTNPKDGKFFVATKSAFAKKPKLNYTDKDIEVNHGNSPGLIPKLKHALEHLPKLNMQGIYQMDYMFDNEMLQVITPTTIDGVPNEQSYVAAKPNTIVYAVPEGSDVAAAIKQAKIGVAIHIKYKVEDNVLKVERYTSSVDEFNQTDDVFLFNIFVDINQFQSPEELKGITSNISETVKKLEALDKKVNWDALQPFYAHLKTYVNAEVRQGKLLNNPTQSASDFISWMDAKLIKEVEKLKSEQGRFRKQQQRESTITTLTQLLPDITNSFTIVQMLSRSKDLLVALYDTIQQNSTIRTFYSDDESLTSLTTAEGEGYAISTTGGGFARIAKLVNRLSFSRQNFQTGSPTT